jgi:ribosome-binding ATPase YchF (GTP1/OBG family)
VKSYPDAPLYDPKTLRTIFFEFENADWEKELADFNNTDVEVPAKLTVDGKIYPNVGVHFRGASSFFTVGEDECRAWSIARGTAAQAAAGEIHSDIQRGFIRAEVVAYDALTGRGSMAACREHGEVRLEGKEYVVQDGDIINFRFAT